MYGLGQRLSVWSCIVLSSIGFVLSGCLLLPYLGIEADEALAVLPIFGPVPLAYRIRAFHRNVPLMLMDYVGALKAWLYSLVFHLVQPSIWSLRIPALLLGAITICLFALLLERVSGLRAALAGALLLATDTIFLLTTEFDWGPVAIQHLALVAACWLLFEFWQSGCWRPLAAGFFALGLGLWDKATFGWVIGGLVAASLVVFRWEVWKKMTIRNTGVAIAGFLLGLWPLLVFNVRHDWPTFRGNAVLSANDLGQKAEVLECALNGTGLFSFMVSEPSSGFARAPETRTERAATRVATFAGELRGNFVLPALAFALAGGLILRELRRAVLFAVVFMTITWAFMAMTRGAGGSVHHAVLLWPFPQFTIAIVLPEISRRCGRVVFIALVLILCATNVLVTNQYLARLIRDGPSLTWTDAVFPLANSMRDPSINVVVLDWDMYEPLVFLREGKLRLQPAVLSSAADPASVDHLLALQRTVYVTHVDGKEFFPDLGKSLRDRAAALGYRKELLRVIADSHDRPVFQAFQFVKQ